MSMTDEELQQAQSTIVALETEIAGLSRESEDCLERARDFNRRLADANGRRTSLQVNLKRLRQAVNEEVNARSVEAKRKANEESAARAAEAKKAAEEEAAKKAAEPPQPTELELLRLEVAALRDELKK